MSFTAYPEYVESGVDWLGVIPAHWSTQRLKYLSQVTSSGLDKKSNKNEPTVRFLGTDSVYSRERIDDSLQLEVCTASPTEIQRLALQRGDIILTKDSVVPTRIADTAIVAEPLENVVCGYHLILVRANTNAVLPKFLFYHLACQQINSYFLSMARGTTIIGISSHLVGGIDLCLPSLEEQSVIADFLDHETARIDALIEEQQRLIEVLQEKHGAMVSHAVITGVNSCTSFKDSDVEWMPRVPENWKVIQLRRVVREIEQGFSPECDSRRAARGEWGVLKAGCTNYGHFRSEENKALPEEVEARSAYEVKQGDLLMSRASGSVELIGSAAVVFDTPEKLLLSDKIFRISPDMDKANPEFLSLVINSAIVRPQIRLSISGAEGLANNITKATVRALRIPLPPLEEQREIVRECAKRLSDHDKLTNQASQSMARLSERRKALISAAVTGKIDLRKCKWSQQSRYSGQTLPQAAEEGAQYG